MKHKDEEILKIRRDIEKSSVEEVKKNQSIYDAIVTIKDTKTKFLEHDLGEYKIMLPYDFDLVEERIIKQIYPLGNPPQIVYASKELVFWIGFNKTAHKISNSEIYEFSKVGIKALERVGPSTVILKKENINIDDNNMSIIKLTSKTLEDVMVSYMFYVSLCGELLIGVLNYDVKYDEEFDTLAEEVVKSFRLHDPEVSE